ncbi:PoNe immunity protein domain-containing protein [Pseudomonas fluorescens]|nr:PoNe immunity protein domain-containing protein [Pseudomonas fluorescens]
MPNLPTPDWPRWFSWKISEANFEQRRERYVLYKNYPERFDDFLNGMHRVTSDLPKYRERSKPGGLMSSTNQRLWDALNWINLQYSAGAPVEQLAEAWPYALEWAEEYGDFDALFDQSPEAGNYMAPHAALRTEEYWIVALRLTCFGLLSGYSHTMPRVMLFLDYANELMGVRDGLLERLVRPFVADRGTPPDTCTRHLPYRKLLKVFSSAAAKRPELLKSYLDEWYHASRREPYVDRHLEGGFSHFGYWAWEAAAVTWLLGIDDSSYREMPFYPKDWADFAKQYPPPPAEATRRSGDSCPQSGWWWSDASHDSLYRFESGDIFPDIASDTARGITVWHWALDQRA